jgi:nuclear RNA export factor
MNKQIKLTLFIPIPTSKLTTRITPTSDPLSIRGAARPTVAGRIRRNAVSAGSVGMRANTPPAPMTVKTLDIWREFVQKRWNPEARFLNLEASVTGLSWFNS